MAWFDLLEGVVKHAVGVVRPIPDQVDSLKVCSKCPALRGVFVTDQPALKAAAMAFGHFHSVTVLQCGECECLLGAEVPASAERIDLTIHGRSYVAAGKTETGECPRGWWS